MIDPATSAKIPGMDASLAGSAASQRSDAKAGNGFHDALSNAGHSGRSRADREDTAGERKSGMDAGAEEQPEAATTGTSKPGRPLIDVSHAALARAAAANAARGTTADGVGATEAAAGGTPIDDTVPGRKVAKGHAVQTAANANPNGAPGETLDPDQMAAVVKHVQAGKGDKVDKTERTEKPATDKEVAVATDGQAEVAPEGKAPDLGDVLTLLGNGTATAPQAAQASARTDRPTTGRMAEGELAAVSTSSGDLHASRTAESSDLPSAETGGADAAEADRTFRFLRADGKGQALSMRVGQSDGETVKYDVGTARDAGQTVAVLEARRFLAPVSNNAAALTSAMIGDGEWTSAMMPGSELANAAAQSSSGKVVNTLKLQMSPIELGNVTATLRLHGEELSVMITVETHAAHKQLSKDQDDMLKALRAQGFAVDQIQISVNVGAADRADSSQSGPQGQSQGQQAQGGNSGSNGSSERRTGAQQAEGASGMGKTTDDTSAVQTASGGAGASRPGHVYI